MGERFFNRIIRNTVMITLVGLPPLLNHDATGRVLKALSGRRVDCSSGEPVSSGTYSYDLIAVPGAGSYIDLSGNLQPNKFQRGRLTAAAYAYINNYAPQILLLDGEEEIGNVDKEYLREQVKEISGNKIYLPDDSVFIDKKESVNTATSMGFLSNFMKEHSLKKVVVVTDAFHGARSEILACNNGINSSLLTVEDLLAKYDTGGLDGTTSIDEAIGIRLLNLKEELEIFSLMYDPRGNLSTQLKSVDNLIEENLHK